MKITDSPNMGTVNHAMEDLQHRISLNIAQLLPRDINGQRGETQASEGKIQSEKRERNRRAVAKQVGKTKGI